MYFMVNLAFVNQFDNWTDSIMPTIDFDITEDEQTLQLAFTRPQSIYIKKL